jgi:hypothetical protein
MPCSDRLCVIRRTAFDGRLDLPVVQNDGTARLLGSVGASRSRLSLCKRHMTSQSGDNDERADNPFHR